MKVIDAIQLPEVLNGSKWVAFVMQGTTLPCQTFRVNSIGQMVWCDNDSSAEFSLRRLNEECVFIDPGPTVSRWVVYGDHRVAVEQLISRLSGGGSSEPTPHSRVIEDDTSGGTA